MEMTVNDKTGRPVVAVLLSAYCGVQYLPEQLDSIRGQQGVTVRLMVRDDGSPDDGATLRLLRDYAAAHPDLDMTIIEGHNLGWAMSFMQLVYDAPEADYYAFADQDDIWLPEKLHRAITEIENETKAEDRGAQCPMLYYSNMTYYKHGRSIGTIRKPATNKDNKTMAFMRNLATGCTVVFNNSLRELLLLSKGHQVNAHDYFAFLTAVMFGRAVADDETYILYRQHDSNQVGSTTRLQRVSKELGTAVRGRKCEHRRLNQAKTFYHIYRDRLSRDEEKMIRSICDYKQGFVNRMRLIMNQNMRMEDLTGTIGLKVRLLLGKF